MRKNTDGSYSTDHPLLPGVTITKCPPAVAKGSEMSKASRAEIARRRREWRKAQAEACRQTE